MSNRLFSCRKQNVFCMPMGDRKVKSSYKINKERKHKTHSWGGPTFLPLHTLTQNFVLIAVNTAFMLHSCILCKLHMDIYRSISVYQVAVFVDCCQLGKPKPLWFSSFTFSKSSCSFVGMWFMIEISGRFIQIVLLGKEKGKQLQQALSDCHSMTAVAVYRGK